MEYSDSIQKYLEKEIIKSKMTKRHINWKSLDNYKIKKKVRMNK